MKIDLVIYDIEGFYYFVCVMMVKDEWYIDKFDCVFVVIFDGMENILVDDVLNVVDLFIDWFEKLVEKFLIDEEKVEIEVFGGFDKLMEILCEWFVE